MQQRDDDNIPVLEDVIPEYDSLPPDAQATNEKQKTLWDDDDDFAAAASAVVTPETSADEITWDEPTVALENDDFAGELSDVTDELPTEESTALFRHDEHGDAIDVTEAAVYDDLAAIEADTQENTFDESRLDIPTHGDVAPSPQTGPVDIDELADRILRRLMPDLEDYLHDRIRTALETALNEKAHD